MTRPRRVASVLFLLLCLAAGSLGLAGCAVNPATGERSFTALMPPSKEAEVGREEHPKLVEAFGGEYQDAAIGRYVSSIGRLLQSTSEMPNQTFTFTVLDNSIVNAFALPGGYVYVSRGLLALAGDEAELAGVIAHEIGHVTARHTAQRYSRGVLAGLGAALIGAATGSQMASNVAQVAVGAYIQGYSRDQEFEADQLGVRYLTRAGFDPLAMSSFLAAMGAEHELAKLIAGKEGTEPAAGLFSSHPRTAARVERAAATARAKTGRSPARDRDVFLGKIDGMIYGDSPEQGFVRGREFDHPKLKLRFTAPPGFRLGNMAEAVVGEHADGALMRFDGDRPEQSGMSTFTYLTNQWAPGLSMADAEAMSIGGLEAATGSGRIETQQGAVDVRLVAIRFRADQIYRFLFMTPPDKTAGFNEPFRRATHSFRALSEAEAAALKPLRLRLVKVGPGETPATLARRMAVDDFQLERFLVLNGLSRGARLEPGQRVKIVTE